MQLTDRIPQLVREIEVLEKENASMRADKESVHRLRASVADLIWRMSEKVVDEQERQVVENGFYANQSSKS